MLHRSWLAHVFFLELKKLASYRVDFWLRLVFAAVVRIFLAYYLWDAMFAELKVSTIGGYSFPGMVFYFILAALISNVVFAGIDNFASEVYDGTLTRYLLYPASFFMYKAMTGLAYAVLCIVQVFLGLGLTLYLVGIPEDVQLSSASVILSLVITLGAAYLYRMMQSVLELIAFWAESVWGLQVALYFLMNFFGGGLLPISVFPEWMQPLLALSPFPYLIGFPADIMMGRVDPEKLLTGVSIMAFWSLVFTLSASCIWKRGLKRYSSVGI